MIPLVVGIILLFFVIKIFQCPTLKNQKGGGPTIFGSTNEYIENLHREISNTVNQTMMNTETNCNQTFTGNQIMNITCDLPPTYTDVVQRGFKSCNDSANDFYRMCSQVGDDGCSEKWLQAKKQCTDTNTEQMTCRFEDIKQKMLAQITQNCTVDQENTTKIQAKIKADLDQSVKENSGGFTKALNTAIEKLGETNVGGTTNKSEINKDEFVNNVANTFTSDIINKLSQSLAQSQSMDLTASSGATFKGISQDVSITAVSEFLTKQKNYTDIINEMDVKIDESKDIKLKGIGESLNPFDTEVNPEYFVICCAICLCIIFLAVGGGGALYLLN